MTLDDFIRIKKLTPENAESKIKDLSRSWEGCIGQGIDYQCSPKCLVLDGVHADPEKGIFEKRYEWSEVLENVMFQQLKLW